MPSKCHCHIRWNVQMKCTYYIHYFMYHYIRSVYIILYIIIYLYKYIFILFQDVSCLLSSVEEEGKANLCIHLHRCRKKAFCKRWRGYRVLIWYPCDYVFLASLEGLNHFLHDTFPLLSPHKNNVKIYRGGRFTAL